MGQVWSTLRRRDPHNQTIAVALLLALARLSKSYEGLRAYTFWNVTAVLLFFSTRARGWSGPLLTNSVAIFASYRTASADAHHDFVKNSGRSEPVYILGDAIVHLLPAVAMIIWHKRHKKFVKPQAGAMAFLGQLFFAYSQAGKLDMSQIYVPHDVTYAWSAALLGHMFSPMLSNNFQRGNYGRSLLSLLAIFMPYLLKKLGIRKLRNRQTIMKKRHERRGLKASKRLAEDSYHSNTVGEESDGSDFERGCPLCRRRERLVAGAHAHDSSTMRTSILTGLRRSRSSSNFLQSHKISIV